MIARLAALVLVAACGRSHFELDANDAEAGDGPQQNSVYNYAFVTSTSQLPTMYGQDFAGADALCNARAASAGLPGTYVAYLSKTGVDARDRLGSARGWLRTDGRPFLDHASDIATGIVLTNLAMDETGGNVGDSLVHTGSDVGGRVGASCADYTDAGSIINVGYTTSTTADWSHTGQRGCDQTARLYCFGVDKTAPLVITPVVGRLMFLTVQSLTLDAGGLATADALCNGEAALAGFPGTYRALLATTAASAISRLSLAGPPWIRVDGIPLAATALDFAASKLITTPNVTSSKTYSTASVLTGSGALNQAATSLLDTCDNWTNPSGASLQGYSFSATRFLVAQNGNPCSNRPVYCFQE